ncbi:MAG: SDR family NAD(P)-dependent oxidoreductase [Waddliaceae bacterium]
MKKKKTFDLALVTGASSGIGRQLSRILAEEGIPLIIAARHVDQLNTLAQELGQKVEVTVFPVDLASPQEREKLIEKIGETVPNLVVNNAGFGLYGEALSYKIAQSMAMMEVNAAAVLELSLEAARVMISKHREGVILNVSSAAAFQIFPYFSVYAATKAFVNAFSESFDAELKPYGIRVLTSCPGVVATDFQRRASGGATREAAFSMSVEFAANEIWKQIQQEKPLHIFDWKYRLGTFLGRYFIPKSLLVKILAKVIKNRHTAT